MAEVGPEAVPDDASGRLHVEAVWAGADRLVRHRCSVAAGTRLGEVLEALRDALLAQGADCAGLEAGVFGKRRDAQYRLHDGDRVEFYRPLTADPKLARQRRVQQRRADRPRDKWRAA